MTNHQYSVNGIGGGDSKQQGSNVPQTTLSRRSRRCGAITLLVSVTLPVLLGFAGMAVDVGLLWSTKRRMQAATDAAAIAAAVSSRNSGSYQLAGRDLASFNGFTNGQNGVTVTVNNPPASGAYAANAEYVEVIIAQPSPSYFMRYLGPSSVNVTSRAVAGGASGDYCVFTLDPSASDAFHNDNAINSSCGIMVDSSSSTALQSSGTITAPNVGIVGNSNDKARITGTVTTGIAAAPDPLAYLPAPAVGACNQTNFSKSSGSWNLNPGVYCGGITLHGTATVTLAAGTYILLGGGLTSDVNSSITGNGVTFYNTKDASHAYKPIYTQDSNILNLVAPTTGTYAGILFFQDRSVVSAAQNIIAGGSAKLEGALYFPTTPLVFSSQSAVNAAYTIIVAKSISNQVNTFSVTSDYSSLSKGSPIKKTVLYE
jgi:hypothetical protein